MSTVADCPRCGGGVSQRRESVADTYSYDQLCMACGWSSHQISDEMTLSEAYSKIAEPPRESRLPGLLRAIVDDPDDLARRLVYADALLDAGDPRGELIVAQCRDGATGDVDAVRERWNDALGNDDAREVHFENGMPSAAQIWIDIGRGLEVLDRAPIVHISLRYDEEETNAEEAAERFAHDPRTARLRTLDLTHEQWGDGIAAILGAKLDCLRTLYIGDYDAQTRAADAIVANPTLAPEVLEFAGDSYAELGEGLAILAGSPRSLRLRRLALYNCSLYAGAMDVFATAASFANLVEIDLAGGSNTTNRIGNDGFASIVNSRYLTKLERLAIGNNRVTDIRLLADPTKLPALRALAVNSCTVEPSDITEILAVRGFAELYFGGCGELGDEGVVALARSPNVRALRRLNLAGTGVGAEGLRALCAAPIEKLEWLLVRTEDDAVKAALVARFGDAVNL